MDLRDIKWSAQEKKIARAAFEKAYKQEMLQIQNFIAEKVRSFKDENEVWKLHDYLTEKRREIDEKYDYRYSMLIYVFSRLIRDELIGWEDLQGLSAEKISFIQRLLSL